MILDRVEKLAQYGCMNAGVRTAAKWLKEIQGEQLAPGTYEIENGCRAVVKHGMTKYERECKAESHRIFADIQIVLRGEERMRWIAEGKAERTGEYIEEKDVQFYACTQEMHVLHMRAGEFAIFFPWDVHCPDGCVDVPREEWKIVIKIPVNT